DSPFAKKAARRSHRLRHESDAELDSTHQHALSTRTIKRFSVTPRLGKSLASRRLKPFRFYQSGTRIAQGTLSQANIRCRSAESINLIVANLPVLRLLLQDEHNPLQYRLLGI